MRFIKASESIKIEPLWAVLERELINKINESAPKILSKYTRDDGTLLWPVSPEFQSVDGLDDCYESFHNWALFYMLGGDSWFLENAHREFGAINEYMAKFGSGFGYPMVVKDYQPSYDWFHQSEGNYLFYMLCMADPKNQKSIDQATKFAGFFMNEDPAAQNYDPDHKIIKCAMNGSKGPAFWIFRGGPHYPWDGYNIPFYDVPGCVNHESVRKNPQNAELLGKAISQRQGKGDAVVNLSATSLATNAYLLTGDDKYKNWVKEYVTAWIDRTEKNNGVVPDNVGLSGKVGEYIDGKWYGSYYGWTWPHGWHSVGQAVGVAGQNIALLTQDLSYMDFPRSQINVLINNGIEREDRIFVPQKYGDPGKVSYFPPVWISYIVKNDDGTALQINGWFEFMPMHPSDVAQLWSMTMQPDDMSISEKICSKSGSKFDVRAWHHTKDQGGHDGAWLAFMRGEYPEYPETILKHNISQVESRLAFMETDTEDPKRYGDAYFQRRNPVTCEGLVQLTMGAPLPHYNGGLLVARLRYFDADKKRPGLPPDVSALVSKLNDEKAELQLVNLSKTSARELIIQAGAMGEHEWTKVIYKSDSESKIIEVDDKYLHIHLPPYTTINLELYMKRYANNPSYDLPY